MSIAEGLQRWRIPAVIVGYTVLAMVVTGGVIAGIATEPWRSEALSVVRANTAVVGIMLVIVMLGLAGITDYFLGRLTSISRRLGDDTRLMLKANPEHRARPDGPGELAALARAINELAELRTMAEQETRSQIAAAQADLDRERRLLATLMSELAVAVIACNVDGRIILYNESARQLFDDESMGLGRSIFTLIDRDLIDHANEWIADQDSASSLVATTVYRDRLLQVRVAPTGDTGSSTGYVLVLDDLTEQVRVSQRRDELVRELTEGTRGALGSIQAAIETVMQFPDLDIEDQNRFFDIVHQETSSLGSRLNSWAEDASIDPGAGWARTIMSAADVLSLTARALERSGVATVRRRHAPDGVWVRIDSHALSRALAHLATRLSESVESIEFELEVGQADGRLKLTATWAGLPRAEEFGAWLSEPLAASSGASVRDVVSQHGGEVWTVGSAVRTELVALLGVVESAPLPPIARPAASRPEFYDFDLFERRDDGSLWADRPLTELSFTVFDTETTGLDPNGGDEIISIGAVRIVNCRVLNDETLDQLIDPGRPVPARSTQIHGITTQMVRGQQKIGEALQRFSRFASDTVLVGHNVGFDLQFLRLKEASTGVTFTQPVLDTLLLDAVLHPSHERHSLEAMAERLGVEVYGRHTALGDAIVTARVFVRLITALAEHGLTTLGEIEAASQTTLHARKSKSLYER